MRYEVLTGRLPFRGPTIQILARKRTKTAPPPLSLQSETPQHLNDLCEALLNRVPRQRPSAVEILQAIGADEIAEDMLAKNRAAALRSVELVGREQHLDSLSESFRQVSDGNTRSVFVCGKSGMGKSVLVRNFLNGIDARNEAVILEGRCYEQESVPFKALDSLIDNLCSHLQSLPEADAAGLMPDDIAFLAHLFPVMQRVEAVAKFPRDRISQLDEQQVRQRAFAAMRQLLLRITNRTQDIMFIDDLQWGHAGSAQRNRGRAVLEKTEHGNRKTGNREARNRRQQRVRSRYVPEQHEAGEQESHRGVNQ